MQIGQVMDEVGEAIKAIPELRVFPYFADRVTPPAAVVGFPEIVHDATMARGADRLTLPVALLVSRVDSRTARDRLLALQVQVKAAIEDHEPSAYDSARVTGVVFNHSYPFAGVEYDAAEFTIDIIGSGGQ